MNEHSNPLVVNEVEIDATPEAVFELLVTDAGRDSWLEPDPAREIRVDAEERPDPDAGRSGRVAWTWWREAEAPREVELWVVAIPTGTRVIAIESAPALPIQMLAHARAVA